GRDAGGVGADAAPFPRIATPPYVQSITAVGRARRNEPVGPIAPLPAAPFSRELLRSAPSREQGNASVSLDPPSGYGSSLIQLNGINAKAAQDSGYTGSGVV